MKCDSLVLERKASGSLKLSFKVKRIEFKCRMFLLKTRGPPIASGVETSKCVCQTGAVTRCHWHPRAYLPKLIEIDECAVIYFDSHFTC